VLNCIDARIAIHACESRAPLWDEEGPGCRSYPPQEDPGTTGTAGAEYTSGRLASNDVRPSSSSSRCCLPSCFGRCKRRQAFADQLAGPTSAAVCILRSVRATAPQWGDPRRRWQRHGCDRVAIPSDMIPIGRDLTRMPISALTDMPSSVTSRSCPVAVVDVAARDLTHMPRRVRPQQSTRRGKIREVVCDFAASG